MLAETAFVIFAVNSVRTAAVEVKVAARVAFQRDLVGLPSPCYFPNPLTPRLLFRVYIRKSVGIGMRLPVPFRSGQDDLSSVRMLNVRLVWRVIIVPQCFCSTCIIGE